MLKKEFKEKEEKKSFQIWKMTEVMATTQTNNKNNNKNKYR